MSEPIEHLEVTDGRERFAILNSLADRAELAARTAARSAAAASPVIASDEDASSSPSTAGRTWRQGWSAVALTTASRAVLAVLAGLLFWSLAPSVLGWHPTVVMTGSMEPRLHPGDVVISRPVPTQQLRIGQVLLADDPDHRGRLRLHRFVAVRPDGTLTLRGDANSADDSSPVARSSVHGVASLRVPAIGSPLLWLRTGDVRSLLLTGAGLGILMACAFGYRPRDDESGPNESTQDLAAQDQSGQDRDTDARHSRGWLRAGASLLVLAAFGAGQLAHPGAAHAAPFKNVTADPASTWSAVPYFTCRSAVLAASPYLYYRLNETSGSTASDSSGNARNGTYHSVTTTGVTAPCNRDSTKAVTLNGSSSYVSAQNQSATPTTFSVEIWFKTTTSTGGLLIGFGDKQNGAATTTDRDVYLTNTGSVVFGVLSGAAKRTITSPGVYNDGKWHLVDATLAASGMALYLDGTAVASDASTTVAGNYSGYWRIGFENLVGWTSAPSSNFYSGSLADAAVYSGALSATQIASHYNAS